MSPSTTMLTRARPTCEVSPPHTCDLNFQSVITKCLSALFTSGDFHGPPTRRLQACGGVWEKPQTPDSLLQTSSLLEVSFGREVRQEGRPFVGRKSGSFTRRDDSGNERGLLAVLPAEGFSVWGTTNRNFWSFYREILLHLPTAPSIDQKKAGCQHSHGAMGPAAGVLSEHSAPPPRPFEPLTPGMLPSPTCSAPHPAPLGLQIHHMWRLHKNNMKSYISNRLSLQRHFHTLGQLSHYLISEKERCFHPLKTGGDKQGKKINDVIGELPLNPLPPSTQTWK